MAWISWSRTSATTKRTTTISRKPMRCSSKMLRWKRMCLLLRAELRLTQNHKDVIMSAHPQELYPSGKESGLVEPGDYSPVACSLWKQLSTLLRHGHLPQEDGAIEFLECKDYLRNKFVRSQYWSDEVWKSRMTKGGGNKKRFQSSTDSSGGILYLQALQSHLGRNRIDPSLEGFLQAQLSLSDVQSIYTPSWIQDWYQENKTWAKDRRFFSRLWIRRTRNIKIQMQLTWMHRVFFGTSRKYGRDMKMQYIGLTSNLLKRKDSSSIKHDRTQSSSTTHSQIQKAVMMETGEIIYDKVYASSRFPPIFPGTENAGGVEFSQPTQPKTKHPIVRTERLVKSEQPSILLTQEIDKGVLFGCESKNLSIGRLVSGQSIGLFTQREDMDIDFKVSESPHVKVFWNAYMWHVLEDLLDIVWSMDHKMDKIFCQTFLSSDLLHSSFVWIQTVLPCFNTVKQCRLGLFPDSDFAGDLECSKSTSGGTLCVFGSHIVVPISCLCEKQTSVSHSSTQSEIISLDAGLRLDGIPALDLLDLIVFVFEAQHRTMIERGNPLFAVIRITCKGNLEEYSTFWIMLTSFLQTSHLRIRKLW